MAYEKWFEEQKRKRDRINQQILFDYDDSKSKGEYFFDQLTTLSISDLIDFDRLYQGYVGSNAEFRKSLIHKAKENAKNKHRQRINNPNFKWKSLTELDKEDK